MKNITRVGVDLAKNVLQVCGVDALGKVVFNKSLSREKFLPWCSAELEPGCVVLWKLVQAHTFGQESLSNVALTQRLLPQVMSRHTGWRARAGKTMQMMLQQFAKQ